ncbi:class I SAM-dependent methyltransferase [Reyranella sp.]|uniref:class I SAM-dependent methyltransferase n=1 Tax=Reyranella sp. TaxID=1929291 RepID=UPI003D10B101
MSGAEFDRHAAGYDGGLDHPIKRLLGNSADEFIAVKARWLLRHEPALRTTDAKGSGVRLLDYGCGAGDLMRVLTQLGARGSFTGCDVSGGMLAEVGKRWPRHLGPPPALARQDGARTPFADGRFDVATVSAVLHHVPVAERPAVYAELGRVLKPGGRLYVFEHNPRNRLVRHVIARTPIDENAILLDAREVQDGLLGSGRYELETDYLMFTPPGIAWLRFVDRALAWLPLGAQYVVAARKPA